MTLDAPSGVSAGTVRLDAAGLSTACLLAGPQDAPPLVLLHGGGIDRAARSWRETIPALIPRFRVIAPDLPGYGDSEGFGRPHAIPDLGRWLIALLDALGLDRADLVGNSMGGGMALWTALEAPHRVGRLVPVGSYGLARRAPLHRAVWAHSHRLPSRNAFMALATTSLGARAALSTVFADPRRVSRDLVAEMRDEAQVQRRAMAFRDFMAGEVTRNGFRTVLMDRLGRLQAETLFIHGRSDRFIPVRHAREAAARAPNARLVELDAGHWPMREAPDAFQAVLVDFLAA